jgi:hypothetical protein
MPLLLGAVVLIGAGCGGGGSGGGGSTNTTSSPAAQRLQREDLIAVSHALKAGEGQNAGEVAATKLAWPLIANGLRADAVASARRPIAAAADSAADIRVPALLQEAQAVSLTGPGAQLAGLFRTYVGLAGRGWTLVNSSTQEIEHGSPATARFARENLPLYIESIYDGHFSLAQLGKKLRTGYQKLGGPAAFGSSLTQAEVDALADTYSEANDRLHPHVGVRLGS